MTKKPTKPNWYDDSFYNKSRTPEEWLFELWKRYQFKQDEIGLSCSIYILSKEEQEKLFIEFIFDQRSEKLLKYLEATPPQPIKYPSVSDLFIMYHRLVNTDWYKNHPKREVFEDAISVINSNGTLSREQKIAFCEMHKTPWCVFYENHQQENWCPKKEKEMEYLNGIPLSLDPGYIKKDTITVLKKKLNAWVGKIQDIRKQFDRWQESKILAVFDLTYWFKIQGIEYANIDLYKLIWPDRRFSALTGEEVNPYDDIDHSINLANKVIDRSPISSLFCLCETRKASKESIKA